jgi:uncharacterized membrane protein
MAFFCVAGHYLRPSSPPQLAVAAAPPLRTLKDRLRQVALFEVGGLVLISPPFSWTSGVPMVESAGLLAVLALIAALWNGAYNTGFDWVEGRITGRPADHRPWPLRVVHALGFEGGLVLLTLPVVMLWTDLAWWPALVADLGLALAYAGYAFVFNLAYDRLFPIPAA